MTAPDGSATPLPVFGIRLRDAYLHEARVRRVVRRKPRATPTPTLSTTLQEWGLDEARQTLIVIVSADVKVPYRSGEADLHLHAATLGEFASLEPIEVEVADQFAKRDAVVLLFPYLRAFVGELGRMTGLGVPPLPTLDVTEFMAQAEPPVPKAGAKARRSPHPSEAPVQGRAKARRTQSPAGDA